VRTFIQGKGESIVINGDISVTVLDLDGDEVTLAIDVPEWMGLDEDGAGLEYEFDDWSPLQPR
jgi:hypothetical protein